MTVVASGTRKSTEDDKARIRELMGEDAVLLDDGNPRALLDMCKAQNVDILIAGGRNMYTALKARIPFLDINQERDFGYAGYTGMVELARQLVLTIDSPVGATGGGLPGAGAARCSTIPTSDASTGSTSPVGLPKRPDEPAGRSRQQKVDRTLRRLIGTYGEG